MWRQSLAVGKTVFSSEQKTADMQFGNALESQIST